MIYEKPELIEFGQYHTCLFVAQRPSFAHWKNEVFRRHLLAINKLSKQNNLPELPILTEDINLLDHF